MPHRMMDQIHWHGHDSFQVAGSLTVYFDPWDLGDDVPKADLILISHDHYDHCSPEDVARISKPDTVIVTEARAASRLSGDVRVVRPGQTLEVKGVRVAAVPAYNTDKNFHPRANNWLGFVLEMDGARIYHTGDSDFIPEMKDLDVDIAFIPVSGTYVMDADQGVAAARAIKPRVAVPMHYGKIVGSEADAKRFAEALRGEIDVVLLTRE